MSILNFDISPIDITLLVFFFFWINTHLPAVLFLSYPAAIWEADLELDRRTFFF